MQQQHSQQPVVQYALWMMNVFMGGAEGGKKIAIIIF